MFLNLKIAIASLAVHKMRAILAMLGVFLGALAFTGVQSASLVMVKSAEVETEKLGPNLFAAVSGQIRFRRSGGVRARGLTTTFTVSDARALIRGVPSVSEGTPFITSSMPVRWGGTTVTSELVAAWPSYERVRNFHPDIGRFFTDKEEAERAKVCVLGRKIAERLFKNPEDAVGKTVNMYRAGFKVLGVMEAKGRDITGSDQDEVVLMPLSTFMRRASNQDWVTGAFMTMSKNADISAAKAATESILRKRHKILPGEKDDFSTLTPKDAIQLQTQAIDLVHTLGLITSSVSFAVGGMGILSIMVLMVRARRMEIGIRRAVGGRRKDIVGQFIMEAGVMSASGGLLGVAASIGLVALVCHFGAFPFVLDPLIVVGTLLASALLGVVAGSYPAWQAARIEILDVLKV